MRKLISGVDRSLDLRAPALVAAHLGHELGTDVIAGHVAPGIQRGEHVGQRAQRNARPRSEPLPILSVRGSPQDHRTRQARLRVRVQAVLKSRPRIAERAGPL